MLDAVLELIQTIIGTSLDTVGKLNKQKPELRREAAQGLLSFYQDLERLKLNAKVIENSISWIYTWHVNHEYDALRIGRYVSDVNEAHRETMRILGEMIFVYESPIHRIRGPFFHTHSIMKFLAIKDPKLAEDILRLLGIKYHNILTLLECDLIDRKQMEKSLRKLEYFTHVHLLKIGWREPPYSIDSLRKIGAVETRTLDADNINDLIRFNKRVRRFINKVDVLREKIRKFMAQNFEIEDLF